MMVEYCNELWGSRGFGGSGMQVLIVTASNRFDFLQHGRVFVTRPIV